MTDSDKDWPEVVRNSRKVRRMWAQMSHTLGWEGVDTQIDRNFYKAMV